MANLLQQKKIYNTGAGRLPVEFVVVCIVAFIAGLSTTVYFCNTMGDEMQMPGGWKMSMMWMRMPGETGLMSSVSFLVMWLAMMVAMMMPSALPMFLKTQRSYLSLCLMASGYFTVWLIAGFGIYAIGTAVNNAAMHSASLSRAIPLLSGTLLIAAGAFQFTPRKMKQLSCCRSQFGCAVSATENETGFLIGCRQGMVCCACCAALMMAQLILGIMNLFVMVAIALIITAEKLMPRPLVIARTTGIVAIITGIKCIIGWCYA